MTANDLIQALSLEPHPEGGYFRETWRAPCPPGARSSGTAIYFLLTRGPGSAWHRVDAAEMWHFYAGAPLELRMSKEGSGVERRMLGTDLASGECPQIVVPTGVWQAARTCGDWTLVGCTVTPGFEFDGFEMAPPGWEPDSAP